MNYRTVELHASEAFTSDTTKVIDININDAISNLILLLSGTNTAETMTAHYVNCLTKVEIVDGSDVILSLDGYELEALDWYHNKGKFRTNYNYSMGSGSWNRAIGINFGRYLWDRIYALDPTKFNNLQLKVSIDVDGGGSTNTPFNLRVMANIFDEAVPSLMGVLMSKELKQWTMANTVHEYTDLPTDFPYRALYFRPFLLGTEPNRCVSNIKITEDTDKKIPIDMGAQDLNRILLDKYPLVVEDFYFPVTSSVRYIYCAPSTRVVAHITRWVGSTVADQEFAAYNGDGGRLDVYASVAGNAQVSVRGAVPHCVYEIPFGIKDDVADAYNVTQINSLKADITGAAAAQGFLFVQQYRPY